MMMLAYLSTYPILRVQPAIWKTGLPVLQGSFCKLHGQDELPARPLIEALELDDTAGQTLGDSAHELKLTAGHLHVLWLRIAEGEDFDCNLLIKAIHVENACEWGCHRWCLHIDTCLVLLVLCKENSKLLISSYLNSLAAT
jgi:hypothetical protein